MDPATHLILPMLFLLSARINPRLAIPLSLFAIFPDFDSVFGIHRATLHNLFIVAIIPLIFVFWARFRKPELFLPGLVILFYLSSHILLDLGGVALFYPFFQDGIYLEPSIELHSGNALWFNLNVEYGTRPLVPTTDYVFVSELGFAYALLFALLAVIFRKEAIRGVLEIRAQVMRFLGFINRRIRK